MTESRPPIAPTPTVVPAEVLRLQSVPFWHGILWIRRAFALFMQYPVGFAGLFSASMLGMMLIMATPLVGALLASMAVPWLSLGFMQATRRGLAGERPLISVFFVPLRTQPSRVRELLLLGATYTAAVLLMGGLAYALNGDALNQFMSQSMSDKPDPQQLAQNPQLQSAILWLMGSGMVLSIAFWHAPALVYWGHQPLGRALVFSLMALWCNKVTFTVYAAGWFVMLMLFSLVCAGVLGATGLVQLLPVGTLLGFTVLSTVFHMSTYFSFAGCFGQGDAAQAL